RIVAGFATTSPPRSPRERGEGRPLPPLRERGEGSPLPLQGEGWGGGRCDYLAVRRRRFCHGFARFDIRSLRRIEEFVRIDQRVTHVKERQIDSRVGRRAGMFEQSP